MKVTKEQYLEAKKIVVSYEIELQKEEDDQIETMKKDLEEYFSNHDLIGRKISSFELEKGFYTTENKRIVNIIPVDPYFEEIYWNDEVDKDIAKIGDKYGIRLGWIYWVYPK